MTSVKLIRIRLNKGKAEYRVKIINTISTIIKALVSKNKSDGSIQKINDYFSIARKEVPERIVKELGVYLWKYRNEIKQKDEKFFMSNNYEDEIKQLSEKKGELPEISGIEEAPEIILKLKKTWLHFTNSEKVIMWKRIGDMLKDYVNYLKICKRLTTTS